MKGEFWIPKFKVWIPKESGRKLKVWIPKSKVWIPKEWCRTLRGGLDSKV